jgi:secreted trypsin-like serine protease
MQLKRPALPVLLALVAACAVAAPAGAVVNGTPVDIATVPWFADTGCGATLVMPDRVLTAAHCVAGANPATDIRAVRVGTAIRTPTHVALHPNWRAANGENYLDDVAIVQLDQPVTGVPLVQLGRAATGSDALILGKGRPFAPGTGHSEGETLDSTLRAAPLRVISDAECARAFKGKRISSGERFDKRMLCAIDDDGRAPLFSGCFGDSGGPLWTGTAAAPVQLGVVSWGGDRCGADHLPSVFADVTLYRDFILDPTPVWAPTKAATARIAGTARAGRKLTCSAPGYRPEAGAKLSYKWSFLGVGRGGVGAQKVLGRAKTYRIASRDRGHRIGCQVQAGNDGGFAIVGVASKLVAR